MDLCVGIWEVYTYWPIPTVQHQKSYKERAVSSFNKAYSIIINKDDVTKVNAKTKEVLK